MQAGDVVAMFLEETRFGSREEWERACAGVWDAALAELRTNPGFKGLAAFWADDDTARGGVMGLWTRWSTGSATRPGRLARFGRSSTPSSSAAPGDPGSTSPTPRSTSPPP